MWQSLQEEWHRFVIFTQLALLRLAVTQNDLEEQVAEPSNDPTVY